MASAEKIRPDAKNRKTPVPVKGTFALICPAFGPLADSRIACRCMCRSDAD